MLWLCKYRTAWRSCHLQTSTKAKADKAEFTDENLENEVQLAKEAKEHKVANHILIVAQVAGLDLLDQSTKKIEVCAQQCQIIVLLCSLCRRNQWSALHPKKWTSYPLPDLCSCPKNPTWANPAGSKTQPAHNDNLGASVLTFLHLWSLWRFSHRKNNRLKIAQNELDDSK